MSEWNMLVKKIFDEKRSKNSAYRLGDAMRDAKKVYKKTTKTAKGLVNMPFGKKRKGRRTRRRGTRRRRHRGGEGDQQDQNQQDQHDQNQQGQQDQQDKKSNSLFGGLF
jgi:hypothetical protein